MNNEFGIPEEVSYESLVQLDGQPPKDVILTWAGFHGTITFDPSGKQKPEWSFPYETLEKAVELALEASEQPERYCEIVDIPDDEQAIWRSSGLCSVCDGLVNKATKYCQYCGAKNRNPETYKDVLKAKGLK